ncbi:phage Gp37/Gp68 family protein [Cupriavidus pampae]|uniref:Phage Gp37/Gp68 family protein n=1 Tax=Cupriavidus pampae TaxID=659251 RepID=A0ABN7ZPH7_9BURK|nr:phage Gp37/Gp68 family protein [Cupriavidus pampae]CAG9186029.1 hypothetical protein LMG32289_06225 [Cupriavidus pampae]
MSENSNIEWTDHTWNPWEGCQKVGPGCDLCYAETRNARFAGGHAVNWGPGAPRRRTSPSNWRKMVRWNAAHAAFAVVRGRRQRVFCASLSDVFDNEVPIEWFIDMLDVWRQTPNLDKLVLSKRIGNAMKRLREAFDTLVLRGDCAENPLVPWLATWIAGNAPADIWLGATVVNQAEADRDIPKLLRVPARVRFLSIEPQLGQVEVFSTLTGELLHTSGSEYNPGAIDWIIAGGESGPKARPSHPAWPRALRDQCAAADIPFLYKQHGEWAPGSGDFGAGRFRTAAVALDGRVVEGGHEAVNYPTGASSADHWATVHRAGKKATGRLLDGVLHDAFPVMRRSVAPRSVPEAARIN